MFALINCNLFKLIIQCLSDLSYCAEDVAILILGGLLGLAFSYDITMIVTSLNYRSCVKNFKISYLVETWGLLLVLVD